MLSNRRYLIAEPLIKPNPEPPAPPVGDWILATGLWNDLGVWQNSDVWID